MISRNWLARRLNISLPRQRSQFSFAQTAESIEQRLLLTATTFGQYPTDWGFDGPVVEMNGMLYFANYRDDTGSELYKSDGTLSGTSLVKDIDNPAGNGNAFPENLTPVNGTLFFSAYVNPTGSLLYKTDGTEAGTVQLPSTGNVNYLARVGDKVFYVDSSPSVGTELHITDGTTAGTHLVKDIRPGLSSPDIKVIAELNGIAMFIANDGVTGPDLWRSDGTDAGTYKVKNLDYLSQAYPKFYGVKDGKLYFKIDKSSNITYQTDGTEAGTFAASLPDSLNKDIEYTPGTGNTYFFTVGTTLKYFNGTATITLRTAPTGEFHANLAFANGYLFFATKNENGVELWRSDGTAPGTVMLKDIRSGSTSYGPYSSYPINLKAIGNTLYFSANDGVNGFELWKSDGTTEGTVLVRNLAPGSYSSNPARMTEYNGQLVLSTKETIGPSGSVVFGISFWKSDGTTEGTVMFAGNHAPLLTNTGNPVFKPINQNIPAASNTGTLVTEMLSSLVMTGGSLTDFDDNALQGIAVIGANNTSGIWQFSTNNGTTWLPIYGSADSPLMLAADDKTRIRYQPNPGMTGTVGITFHAWDQTAYANGEYGFGSKGGNFSLSQFPENAFNTVNSTAAKQATFGAFRDGTFFLDANRNRQWNGTASGDSLFGFATATDIPISGDWNGDGLTDVGVVRSGTFYLDGNGSRTWDNTTGGDYRFNFGNPTDKPITGDWNGDGITDIGVWRNGIFYLDYNGNRKWDGVAGGDLTFGFGSVSDTPVTGDWNGDGKFDIGVYRGGTFYLDANGNRTWNGTDNGDAQFGFASASDIPVTGDWNGDGITDVGAYRNGTYYIDLNGNRRWDNTTGGDAIHGFAAATDIPLVGTWGPQSVSPSSSSQSATPLVQSLAVDWNAYSDRKRKSLLWDNA